MESPGTRKHPSVAGREAIRRFDGTEARETTGFAGQPPLSHLREGHNLVYYQHTRGMRRSKRQVRSGEIGRFPCRVVIVSKCMQNSIRARSR